MQRVLFALTMGVAALLFSALLWTASLPLVAWNLVRWVASKVGLVLSRISHATNQTRPGTEFFLVFPGRPAKVKYFAHFPIVPTRFKDARWNSSRDVFPQKAKICHRITDICSQTTDITRPHRAFLLRFICRVHCANSLWSRSITRQKMSPYHLRRWGYFRSLVFNILSAVAWVAASVLGAILVFACIVGSIILWLRGFVGLFYWGREEWDRRAITEDFPTPMPGQEEGVRGSSEQEGHQEESSLWREAWESVGKTRTYRRQKKHESAHFYVDLLLQVSNILDRLQAKHCPIFQRYNPPCQHLSSYRLFDLHTRRFSEESAVNYIRVNITSCKQ